MPNTNYCEIDITHRKPNKETLEAMKEAREGKNLETLDIDRFDDFIASLINELHRST
jgi:hypothetical protein